MEAVYLEEKIGSLAAIDDPISRVQVCDDLANVARELQRAIGEIRRRAIYEATLRPGCSGATVAAELRISAKAVSSAVTWVKKAPPENGVVAKRSISKS